jgi:Beta-lactamase/Helix-turn-helix domain
VFGCARVVYNDCLRLRDETYADGEKISDTEVQRRVITLAKLTPERAWLAEVASVALVQACQDARRAYRNWFGSLSGRRKGPRIRHPKPRRKHGRQSIRLTRNVLRGGAPVLPAAAARAMTTGQFTAAQRARGGLGPDFFADKSWGFGLAVQDDGAYGWAGGFGSTWLMDPKHDLTVIVLTQRMSESAGPFPLHTEFQAAAYAALA